ncbi:hypothetical protein LQZ18_12395 [Lachnospiraceae bacterium ZAX-1]
MQRKKGSFKTFLCSLIPGAGEMYMGFMKQGVSIMIIFCLFLFLAGWLNIGPLLFIVPIIWFYSFFNVHNIRNLSEEDFCSIDDDYIFHLEKMFPEAVQLSSKFHTVLGILLLLIGCSALWDSMARRLLVYILPEYMQGIVFDIVNRLPELIIAIFLIFCGIWLIRGKKKEIDKKDIRYSSEEGGEMK